MKILVTGGSGMVGKHLKDLIPNAYYLDSTKIDLRNIDQVENLFFCLEPEIVIHLAAKVGGIADNLNKPVDYIEDNLLINTNVLKIAHKHEIKRFIGILSTCAYPDIVDNYPLKEEDLHKGAPDKSNLGYGYSKRCLAVQIEAYNSQYQTNYQYLIPSNLYSEYDSKPIENSHFINSLITKIIESEKQKRKDIILWGNGTSLRQCTHALDLAKIIKIVIDNNIIENFNISNPENYSIEQLARITFKVLNKEDWKIDYIFPFMNGQYRKDVSIEKMQKFIPDYKFIKFEEGIKRVYDSISQGHNR